MSDRNIKFEKIPYLDPVNFLRVVKKRLGIHLSKDVKVGDTVSVELPEEGLKFHFYYLGELPEKRSEVGQKVMITMPRTMMVYVCRDLTKFSHYRVEVFIAR